MSEPTQQMYHDLLNVDQIEAFRQNWLQILRQAPWMDLEEVRLALSEEHAILIPLYVTHYEAVKENGNLGVKTHTTRNKDSYKNKPSVDSIKKGLASIGLTYAKLMDMASKNDNGQGCAFHDTFWKGHAQTSKKQPPLPNLIKFLLDEKIRYLYSGPGQARVSPREDPADSKELFRSEGPWTDWAILISLRIDRLFTNKDIILSLNITCYDNAVIHEGYWPIPEDEFEQFGESTIQKLDEQFQKLFNRLFNSDGEKPAEQASESNRKQLTYESVAQDLEAGNWLNLNHAVLSPEGVSWKIGAN